MFDEKPYSLKMDKTIEVFSKELSSLRTGRANAAMLDLVKVDVYGQLMPINQVGSITTPEPRMINIQVWDQNNVSLIDSAIKKSELGLNPQVDGQLIRLPIPELNEERRIEIKKMIKSMGEKCKVSVRNIRREANDELKKILKNSIKKKIQYLTLFTFSTENWKRPGNEINYLFSLLENFLKKKIKKINNNNINSKIQVNVAFNYGSKNEILNAMKILKKKKLKFSEKNFINNLYTKSIPDPEILIRTGNTKRLSNFMLWQLAYTEIFFEKKMWPDFSTNDFDRIIMSYNKIKRKFGS